MIRGNIGIQRCSWLMLLYTFGVCVCLSVCVSEREWERFSFGCTSEEDGVQKRIMLLKHAHWLVRWWKSNLHRYKQLCTEQAGTRSKDISPLHTHTHTHTLTHSHSLTHTHTHISPCVRHSPPKPHQHLTHTHTHTHTVTTKAQWVNPNIKIQGQP